MEKMNRIYDYLDGRLGKTESDNFELELKEDDVLYSEFLKIKNALSRMSSLADIEPDTHYYESVLPRFREKLERRKSKKFLPLFAKLATGIAVPALAITLFVTQPWNNPDEMQVKSLTNSIVTKPAKDPIKILETAKIEKTQPTPVTVRHFITPKIASPVIEKNDKDAILLGSEATSDDNESLASHSNFDEAYASLLDVKELNLVELADRYGITLTELVQDMSDADFEKLQNQINPIDN
jgi:hypothetical protein